MSIMVGTGRGATAGILIRNAEALEILEKVDTLVVDKTGTLTEGKPRMVAVIALPDYAEADLVRLAAAIERASEHPLAAAIIAGAEQRHIAISNAHDFRSVTGRGVMGTVENYAVAIGNLNLLSELGIDSAALAEQAEPLRREGQTAIFVAIDGGAAGVLG